MMTDGEFVAIRAFNRQIEENSNAAQVIINQKNRKLVALAQRVAVLEAQLAAETGRRRMAELKLAQRRQ